MTASAYDPFKDESLIHPPKKTRIRVDWRLGAKLLARGEPAESVAATLGIGEDRLWRHFHKSLRFQFLFRQALERNRLAAQLAFEAAARHAVVQRCGRVEEIDAESWKWLARETGLTPHNAETDDNVKSGSSRPGREVRLAAALKDAGRQPPNQALHARIKKERKAMDAQFAELKAWGRAAGILPPASENAGSSAAESQAEAKKTEISENKTQISAAKSQISADKPPVAAATAGEGNIPAQNPAPSCDDDDDVPKNPVRIPRFSDCAPIDLTDMYGNPIPGREHLLR